MRRDCRSWNRIFVTKYTSRNSTLVPNRTILFVRKCTMGHSAERDASGTLEGGA